MSELVAVRTYPDSIHAELARAYLESEGIDATVESPEDAPPAAVIAEWGMGAVAHLLKVPEADLKQADALLTETETITPDME